jgi:hypothetical protein
MSVALQIDADTRRQILLLGFQGNRAISKVRKNGPAAGT